MEIELKEHQILDLDGDIQDKEDCVELNDGQWCLRDNAIYCEDDSKYYFEDNYRDEGICYLTSDDIYIFEDNAIWAVLLNGGEGWICNESDYCYSDISERYFENVETANGHDYYYCERREDYVHADDLDGDRDCWDNDFKVESKRYNLTKGMKYSFGVELETCEGYLEYDDALSLKCVDDGSIEGKEYVTGVLHGNNGVDMLEKICKELQLNDCAVDKSCGIHVHIGGANFNRRFSILSIMLGQMMQDEAFECMPKSRLSNTYCYKIDKSYRKLRTVNKKRFPFTHNGMLRLLNKYVYGNEINFDKHNCKKSYHPNGHYASTRYKWLNLNNCSYKDGPNTIEFRLHSGSLDFNKIYKWVVFCMSFVNFVENHPRTIIETYNKFEEEPSTRLSMRKILVASAGTTDGNVIANYYDERRERFMSEQE